MLKKVYTVAGIIAVILAVTAVVAFTLQKIIGGFIPPLTKEIITFIII